jgi:hypothetical protein
VGVVQFISQVLQLQLGTLHNETCVSQIHNEASTKKNEKMKNNKT